MNAIISTLEVLFLRDFREVMNGIVGTDAVSVFVIHRRMAIDGMPLQMQYSILEFTSVTACNFKHTRKQVSRQGQVN